MRKRAIVILTAIATVAACASPTTSSCYRDDIYSPCTGTNTVVQTSTGWRFTFHETRIRDVEYSSEGHVCTYQETFCAFERTCEADGGTYAQAVAACGG